MKRTPLKRKTPLSSNESRRAKVSAARRAMPKPGAVKVCEREGCGSEFYVRPSRLGQRFCSHACYTLSGAQRPSAEAIEHLRQVNRLRTGKANPNYRHGRRVGGHSRDRRRFVSGQTMCQHPRCLGRERVMNEHHVVYEQHVRKHGGDVFDPRNALCVCAGCHSSHHRRGTRVIPLSALRDANFDFAHELLGAAAYDYLRRRYDGEDPRLDALLVLEAAA